MPNSDIPIKIIFSLSLISDVPKLVRYPLLNLNFKSLGETNNVKPAVTPPETPPEGPIGPIEPVLPFGPIGPIGPGAPLTAPPSSPALGPPEPIGP